MQKVLLAWVGMTDLRASKGELNNGLGPVAQAARTRSFTHILLLSDHERKVETSYVEWLKTITEANVRIHHVRLSGPTQFGEIYEGAKSAIARLDKELGLANVRLTYHLSPGTPAMAAIWILLAKTLYPGELIESSQQQIGRAHV